MKEMIETFVHLANDYSGIEYGINTIIKGWRIKEEGFQDVAIVAIEDQDDLAEHDRVFVSYDGEIFTIKDTDNCLVAVTNLPRILFACLYV